MKAEQQTRLYREHIENYLSEIYADRKEHPQSKIFDAMEYSLLAGGKRLRPIFAFEFCRMCGRDWKNATPFAAAVEMIHTYSLIHDDLPSMDNDDFRRGRPTNHKVYGEAMAILAGDGLLTDAFRVAASCKLPEGENIGQAITVLSQCAGSLGMVGGQALDIMSQSRTLTEQEVQDIQSRKTGALIRCACVLGVIAGGGSQEQLYAAESFANALGLAFQIRDDMLDVIGTREELGKEVGTDEQKNTFVRLYGLDTCARMVDSYTKEAIQALDVFSEHDYMTHLAHSLTDRRN